MKDLDLLGAPASAAKVLRTLRRASSSRLTRLIENTSQTFTRSKSSTEALLSYQNLACQIVSAPIPRSTIEIFPISRDRFARETQMQNPQSTQNSGTDEGFAGSDILYAHIVAS
jgi:hypothetical protein